MFGSKKISLKTPAERKKIEISKERISPAPERKKSYAWGYYQIIVLLCKIYVNYIFSQTKNWNILRGSKRF